MSHTSTKTSAFYEEMSKSAATLQMYEKLMKASPIKMQVEQVIENSYHSILMDNGLYAFGYGKMPATILADKRMRQPYLLSLFGLVCSQAGENNHAILARSAACRALGIGEATFTKYMNLLCEYGYVLRSQPYENGFQTTEYRINYNMLNVNDAEWINLRRTSKAGVSRKVSFPMSQYGNIPKFVMYSEELSVYEKAVYIILLLMGGHSMNIEARRDFIGELCGISDVDIVSRCVKNLDKAGYLLRVKNHGRNAAGTEYTVLLKPSTLPHVPGSWVKHDCLKIIQTKAYRSLLNQKDFIIAVCDYASGMAEKIPAATPAVSEIINAQEELRHSFYDRKAEELIKAGILELKALRKEESAVRREAENAKRRRVNEMAARKMTAEEIFGELYDKEISIPYMQQDGNAFFSETGYNIKYEISESGSLAKDILDVFSTLPAEYKDYVRMKIGSEVPADIRDNPSGRDKAARYTAWLLDGLRCESKLEVILAGQIQKTLLDGINRSNRLGFNGKRVRSDEFCGWISHSEKTETVYRLAQDAIRLTKKKFESCAGEIQSHFAYVRKVFLNSLCRVFEEDSPYIVPAV